MGEIIANCYTIHRYIHDCLPLGVVVLIVVIRVVDFWTTETKTFFIQKGSQFVFLLYFKHYLFTRCLVDGTFQKLLMNSEYIYKTRMQSVVKLKAAR